MGAVSDRARAQQYQQRLSQQFGVPGRVEQNGAVWRIQMGPFASKSQAASLQQRLQSEALLQSLSLLRSNYSAVSEMSVCVKHIHKLMLKVGCLPE